jgi:CheY-like chemotaxis protein
LSVEDDADVRSLTAALLEDEQVDTIACESSEAALAAMLIGGRKVAMIFADLRLRGVMDGIDLAREVNTRQLLWCRAHSSSNQCRCGSCVSPGQMRSCSARSVQEVCCRIAIDERAWEDG